MSGNVNKIEFEKLLTLVESYISLGEYGQANMSKKYPYVDFKQLVNNAEFMYHVKTRMTPPTKSNSETIKQVKPQNQKYAQEREIQKNKTEQNVRIGQNKSYGTSHTTVGILFTIGGIFGIAHYINRSGQIFVCSVFGGCNARWCNSCVILSFIIVVSIIALILGVIIGVSGIVQIKNEKPQNNNNNSDNNNNKHVNTVSRGEFCSACGNKLPQIGLVAFCSSCGAKIESNNKTDAF